jgi:CBS domain containing-hemolysin-like protein
MSGQYRPLETSLLGTEAICQAPNQQLPASVSPDSPAIDVMTDLTRVAAQAITSFSTVDDATERMKNAGVRLLFVTNPQYQVIGILTSQDIKEEKVVTYMNANSSRRDEVTVRDLMTPQVRIEVLQMDDVAKASVGDLIRTFKQMGRQHALVVEEKDGKQAIRGILSTTQIAKQTGIQVDTSEYAGSFAELQASIA